MACIYEIYLDVLFVNNFLMDVLNLFLTGIFLRNLIHKGRILLVLPYLEVVWESFVF